MALNPTFLMQGPDPVPGQPGNLYGATAPLGGASDNGTVFELTLGGTESLLFTFPHPANSGTYDPNGLIVDGSEFSTAPRTAVDSSTWAEAPCGSLAHSFWRRGNRQVYAFCGCSDSLGYFEGIQPNGLIQSGANFYGTTFTNGQNSAGTVFFVQPNGNGGVLYSFGATATDGVYPVGNLLQVEGNNETTFFGVTDRGGTNGTGTVFSVNSSSGVETVLYSFGPSRRPATRRCQRARSSRPPTAISTG